MSRGKRIYISDPNDVEQQSLFKKLEKKIGTNAPHFLEEIQDSNENEAKVILFTTEDDEIDNDGNKHEIIGGVAAQIPPQPLPVTQGGSPSPFS